MASQRGSRRTVVSSTYLALSLGRYEKISLSDIKLHIKSPVLPKQFSSKKLRTFDRFGREKYITENDDLPDDELPGVVYPYPVLHLATNLPPGDPNLRQLEDCLYLIQRENSHAGNAGPGWVFRVVEKEEATKFNEVTRLKVEVDR